MHIDALVLRVSAAREHDRRVALYTRQSGKLTAVAKGAQRPHSRQSPALDAGNLIQCELVDGRGGHLVTGAYPVRCFSRAKSSLPRWAAAQFFLEAYDVLTYDAQGDAVLWDVLIGTLDALDRVDDAAALAVFREGQESLLASLGYGREPGNHGVPRRTALDDAFERIAQRKLKGIDAFLRLIG